MNFSNNSAKSWFQQIEKICTMYSLPHPHNLLVNPPAKDAFKCTVKKAIVNYWENMLKDESTSLVLLKYFGPVHSDLQYPHYVWMTAGNNPYETHKNVVWTLDY